MKTLEELRNMNPLELYGELEAHMVDGLMFHGEMSDYFNFIGLHGFKRIHEYQFYEENRNRRLLCRKVLDIYNKLIPHVHVTYMKYMPDEWQNYTRLDVDDSVLPKYTKHGWDMYREWEEKTKVLYENIATVFFEKHMIIDYNIVSNMLEDVQKELKKIYRTCEELNIVGYDPIHVTEMQSKIHEEYKTKLKELKLN